LFVLRGKGSTCKRIRGKKRTRFMKWLEAEHSLGVHAGIS